MCLLLLLPATRWSMAASYEGTLVETATKSDGGGGDGRKEKRRQESQEKEEVAVRLRDKPYTERRESESKSPENVVFICQYFFLFAFFPTDFEREAIHFEIQYFFPRRCCNLMSKSGTEFFCFDGGESGATDGRTGKG